ncbi:MAG: hypothetical protein WBQ44_10175, partial [Rhodococcus sp. (in: high G+C Gram-positive bacteria)]
MCAALLATGCGGNVEGAPVADTPAEAWDPCSIPADAIAATGLNPEISERGWGKGIEVVDWRRCVWQSPDGVGQYSLTVLYSNSSTVEDFKANAQYVDFFEDRLAERTVI